MSAIHKRDAKGRIVKGGSVGGKNETSFKPLQKATETLDPEAAAELIALIAENPGDSITRLADACGLNPATARELVKRLETRFQPVLEEAKRVTTDSLVELIEEKLPLLLKSINQKKVDDATLRDIAVAFGVLAEKRQLLKGEPTQIMTYQERQNMNEIGPELLKEMERRGMVVDVSFQEVPTVQISNPDVVHEAQLSKTVAAKEKRERRAQNR